MWHPAFVHGPALGRAVAEWFGLTTPDIRTSGLGIPVFFRSRNWTEEDAIAHNDVPPSPQTEESPKGERTQQLSAWRRPIDLGEAQHNVFVPLVDDNMVADLSWRRDLIDLAKLHHHIRDEDGALRVNGLPAVAPMVHLAPIQVTSAWPRMPGIVSKIKALYLRRWEDGPGDQEERLDLWALRLRRLITQALVRLLGELRDSALPTEVFLSHAKDDRALGPGVAERLRDVAAGYGQIDVFYDENDLPSGRNWRARMLGAASEGAGLIAVLGDAYATRYWCRREIQCARTPTPASSNKGELDWNIWRVRPSVVAVTLEKRWSRLVSDLGTAPAVRWQQDSVTQPAEILDQLFREALVAEVQVLYARMLHQELQIRVNLTGVLPVAFVTWTPDPSTLIRLRKSLDARSRADTVDSSQPIDMVVYPGHGFLPTEEEEIEGSLGRDVSFISYEQVADWIDSEPVSSEPHQRWSDLLDRSRSKQVSSEIPPTLRIPVALSAGDADDLDSLGYDVDAKNGSKHVDAAVLRICRALLTGGARLVYGGTLRSSSNFVATINDILPTLFTDAVPDEADPLAPLENWVARPYADAYTAEVRARMAGLSRFFFVGEAGSADSTFQERAVLTAQALSAMRREVAAATDLSISLAGKRWNAHGIMPGVAEEVLCSMEAATRADDASSEVRVVLIGEYGGITRQMVRYIVGVQDSLPDALTLEGQVRGSTQTLAKLLKPSTTAEATDPALHRVRLEQVERRYEDLARTLAILRAVARLPDVTPLPKLGMTVGIWRSIMTTSSVGYIRRELARALSRLLQTRMESAT